LFGCSDADYIYTATNQTVVLGDLNVTGSIVGDYNLITQYFYNADTYYLVVRPNSTHKSGTGTIYDLKNYSDTVNLTFYQDFVENV
jgi:glycine betaine/choline ABC-type transport system substrate-binding protein